MTKRWQWIILAVLAGFMVMSFWGGKTPSQGEPADHAMTGKQFQTETAHVPVVPKRKLVPEDPAKYGMVVIAPNAEPKNQEEWDQFMQKTIVGQKILETPEAQKMLAETKMPEEQYHQTIAKVDGDIAKFEKMATDSPSDPETKKRLQVLYQLKSLSKLLEKKVTQP